MQYNKQCLIDLQNNKKALFETQELLEHFQDILQICNHKFETIKISKYETIVNQNLYKVEIKTN